MTRLTTVLCGAVLTFACGDTDNGPPGPTTPTAPIPAPPPTFGPGNPGPGPGPTIGSAVAISPGQVVRATVLSTDPACFVNWDQTGRCREFDVTPERDGALETTLTWGESAAAAIMDLFVVLPGGSWIYLQEATGRTSGMVPVSAGLKYHLIVMSYVAPQDFELITTLK